MILQVAERSGIPFAAGEEVLVDAQEARTTGRMPLGELADEAAPEVAFHGSRPDALPPPQATAVDAIQMLHIDGFLESLAGALPAQDAGQRLTGTTPAGGALGFGDQDIQKTVAQPPVLVTD